MKNLIVILLLALLTSCSLAPFSTTKTASTLGEGKFSGDAGFAPVPYARLEIGVKSDFDMAVSIEEQSGLVFNLDAKYSIVNNPEGFSFAVLGGVFYGVDLAKSRGAYFAPMISSKWGWFEAYALTRINYVRWSGTEFVDTDDFFVSLNDYTNIGFSYLQTTAGTNFWFNPQFGLNIHLSHFQFLGSDVNDVEANFVPGLGLMFKF